MPVVIAVLLALIWVFALRRWYRQAPTPLESVEHQQRALDALQHAASRSRSDAPAAVPAGPARSAPMPYISRTQRSLAPLAVALAVSLVLAGVGAIWWIGRNTNQKQAASVSTPTTHQTSATTAAPTATTSITAPPPPVAQASITSQANGAVTFAVNRSAYTLAIAATGSCWVRASDPNNTGTPLFEQTLHAGDTQQIPVNGSVVLRLGAAKQVTITLDGQPLSIPDQTGSTLSLTFNGSANGA